MNQSLPECSSLEVDSPHLLGVLDRRLSKQLSGDPSRDEIRKEEIEEIYQLAGSLGGNCEFHFERKAGASYNPKAARIPLVLMSAYPEAETEEIALAILSSLILLSEPATCLNRLQKATCCGIKYTGQFSLLLKIHEQIKELSLSASQSADFSCIKEMDYNPVEIRVLVSMFVDKIRHLHLMTAPDFSLIMHQASLEAEIYSRLAHSFLPFYEPHIKHWLSNYHLGRYLRKNSN